MPFDNLLQLAAEGERQTLESFVQKNPQLKTYFDVGEQAESLRPRIQKLGRTSLADTVGKLEEWTGWYANDWPSWKSKYDTVEEALSAAQAKVEELEARGQTEMTADEIRVIVRETLTTLAPDMTKAEIEKLGVAVNKRLEESVNGVANRFQDVYSEMDPLLRQHERTYGEIVDPKAVFAHMEKMAKDRGVHISQVSARDAYQDWSAPKRAEKEQAEREKGLAEAEERGKAAGRKEALQQSGVSRSPVDGGGGTARMGTVQRRQMERLRGSSEGGDAGAAAKAPLGKGIISRAAASALAEKQAAGAAG